MSSGKRIRILFVGEGWKGSSARSLREALAHLDDVDLDDIGGDGFRPRGRSPVVRLANRLLMPLYRAELRAEIQRRMEWLRPHVVCVYKGNLVTADAVRGIRASGVPAVNVFPDFSPHTHGRHLREAMGEYDLVVSTKPFHPDGWSRIYGYANRCVFVPHGYDPEVHYWGTPPGEQDIDVVMAAGWRPEYEELVTEVGRRLPDPGVSVALAGPGWAERRDRFPAHWAFPGPLFGRSYGEFLRRGKIAIAPVHTKVFVGGRQQPGDEDTTRTYELAAAGVFFLHRRTPHSQRNYQEGAEVVFWDDAEELVAAIRHYLPLEAQRRAVAAAAHARAVPAYSIPARAREVLAHLREVAGLNS
jgi:spore maturation protein CgeB